MKKIIMEVIITSNGGILAPEFLPSLLEKVEKTASQQWDAVYIISGRMPLWCAAAITHVLHPSRGVATFEPRSNAGIVVSRHSADVPIEGSLIPLDGAEKIVLEV